MVFGRKKKANLNDSFLSVDSYSENDEGGLISDRERSVGNEETARPRSKSVTARKLASTVAKFAKRANSDDDDQTKAKAGIRRWLGTSTSGSNEASRCKENEAPVVLSRDGEPKKPSLLAAPSLTNFEVEESPPTAPRQRRWRSKSKDDQTAVGLPDCALGKDYDNDSASVSDHESVIASVVSMFERRRSPRRSPKKLSAECPEMSDLHSLLSNSSSRSPMRSPRSRRKVPRPRSPMKTKEIQTLPVNPVADDSEISISMTCDEIFVSEAIPGSPSKKNSNLAAPSMSNINAASSPGRPRKMAALAAPSMSNMDVALSPGKTRRTKKIRSKTPEARRKAQKQHQALVSPPDSPSEQTTWSRKREKIKDGKPVKRTSLPDKASASCVRRSSSSGKPRQPGLSTPGAGGLRSGSQSSLPGILRSGSSSSMCSVSKWTTGLNSSFHSNIGEAQAYPDPNEDSMSQILEGGESDLEQSLMSLSESITRLEYEHDLQNSIGNMDSAIQERDESTLVKDIRKWREDPVNCTLTRRLEQQTESTSERGTRSTVILSTFEASDDASISQTVAGLVSPQKLREQEKRSKKARNSTRKNPPAMPSLSKSSPGTRRKSSRRTSGEPRRRSRSRPKREDVSSGHTPEKGHSIPKSSRNGTMNDLENLTGRSSKTRSNIFDRTKSTAKEETAEHAESPRRIVGSASPKRASSRGRDKRSSTIRSTRAESSSPRRKSRANFQTVDSMPQVVLQDPEAPKTPLRRKAKLNPSTKTQSRVTSSEESKNEPLTPRSRAVRQVYTGGNCEKDILDEIKQELNSSMSCIERRPRTPTAPNARLRSSRKSPKPHSTHDKKVGTSRTPHSNRRRTSSDGNFNGAELCAKVSKIHPNDGSEMAQKGGESLTLKVKVRRKSKKGSEHQNIQPIQLDIPALQNQ